MHLTIIDHRQQPSLNQTKKQPNNQLLTLTTLHPPLLSVAHKSSTQNQNVISSNTPTLTHLIIHLLHLNDTHLNSYSVLSWYSGKLLLTPFGKRPIDSSQRS